ncbi:hypothetical protein AWW67_02185 [Roseivirga seohaensis]|uniref:Uncharacterized protein n=2 Tax=Roseivirga seohaensis TaxID=1914963 RepID=A0A0L8ANY8_9BACT|nr:hypothetical protein [Roseivirga seohaensis]KOF03945.1 hypothetical protein OB69_02745 [Roseivirga seohaensis subsp. aquiponti]KYG83949.1 hypothetical protein AWW67_02185 [Roseivirga seohaensis]|tara:strand:+ start:48 stop:272 length:225 start_codon:yes stop_codon:yes gene_type:complete
MKENNKKVIRSGITRLQLADVYNISPDVLSQWFHAIGVTHSRTLKPKEVALLVRANGLPENCEMRIPVLDPLNQ